MMLPYFALIFGLQLYSIRTVEGVKCDEIQNKTGVISGSAEHEDYYAKCWSIRVPKGNYVKIDFTKMEFSGSNCYEAQLEVRKPNGFLLHRFCSAKGIPPSKIFRESVSLFYYHESKPTKSAFSLKFHIESENCELEKNFRCSDHVCIKESQVCDDVKDCEDGRDEIGCDAEISALKDLNRTRINTISWLKNQQSSSLGWGKDTHRVITALYLSGGASFQGQDMDEELMVKQMELETVLALLKNSTEPIPVNDLIMYVNALLVTCYNPSRFYGYNLVQILGESTTSMKSPNPGAYLALCNANYKFSESEIKNLLGTLNQHSASVFNSDIQAMTLLAANCIQKKVDIFSKQKDFMENYKKTIKKFVESQQRDGSFGNVYTTALVTQALLSSGEGSNKNWNMKSAVKFLMQKMTAPSRDILSTTLALPVFNDKSLIDVGAVKCSKRRIGGEASEISELLEDLGGKMQVKYSLYVGDDKDIIHYIYVKVPENSTAYDVMNVAQVADPKYKFRFNKMSGSMYVYDIAGIANDPEAGKYWFLYSGANEKNGALNRITESPDKFKLTNGKQLVMWYRSIPN